MNLRLRTALVAFGGLALFAGAATLTPLSRDLLHAGASTQAAGVFFIQSISISKIRNDYLGIGAIDPVTGAPRPSSTPVKLKILLVPGHQPDSGGAQFKTAYERDIVVDIADRLADDLRQDPRFDVLVARSKTAWNPVLAQYFATDASEIEAFRASRALDMAQHLGDGSVLLSADQVFHVTASTPAAIQLYGINTWASENAYDITIHLHINDYAGRRAGRAGKYTGFAVYVPDHQYSNAVASRALGESIASRLNQYKATSTSPGESAGVVEDQDLIAIGSNNSADDAALLIEYAYIYEAQLAGPAEPATAATYADATYRGLLDFLSHASTTSP